MKKKIFYCSNLAYYAKVIGRTDAETMISMSETEGGTHGEFAIKWVDVSGSLVPQIQAFDDSWKALSEMPELISALSQIDDKNIDQEGLNFILKKLGYEDETAYTDPEGKEWNEINKDILLRTKKDLQKEIDKIDEQLKKGE